jgi:hypothetical protein
MDENNPTNSNVNQTSKNLESGNRVIRPSSASIEAIKEAKARHLISQQKSLAAVQEATPTEKQQPLSQVSNSLYPEPTKNIGIADVVPASPNVPSLNTENDQNLPNTGNVVLFVKVVSAAIVLINMINLINWFSLNHSSAFSIFNLVDILVILALAIGIFFLKELARIIYVCLAVISIILSCIGIYNVYSGTRHVANAQSLSASQTIRLDQAVIKDTNRNTSLSPEQKESLDQRMQNQINSLSGNPVEDKAKQYLTDGLLIFVAIFPLLFFTRPKVKAVFK